MGYKEELAEKIIRAQCAIAKFGEPIMRKSEYRALVKEYEDLCAIFGETPYVSQTAFSMIRYSCQLVYKAMLQERENRASL